MAKRVNYHMFVSCNNQKYNNYITYSIMQRLEKERLLKEAKTVTDTNTGINSADGGGEKK